MRKYEIWENYNFRNMRFLRVLLIVCKFSNLFTVKTVITPVSPDLQQKYTQTDTHDMFQILSDSQQNTTSYVPYLNLYFVSHYWQSVDTTVTSVGQRTRSQQCCQTLEVFWTFWAHCLDQSYVSLIPCKAWHLIIWQVIN